MRTLHADLVTAQEAATKTSFNFINLPDFDGGLDLSSYLYHMVHTEQISGGGATMLMKDLGSWFVVGGAPKDIRGQKVQLGYGFVTGSGNRYSETGPVWIKNVRIVSAAGQFFVQLECWDFWQKMQAHRIMGDTVAAATGWNISSETITIFGIIDEILTGFANNVILDSSDGIVDVVMPQLQTSLNDSIMGIIMYLISLTNCYIRVDKDVDVHIGKLPETSDVGNTYDINSPGHQFISLMYDDEPSIPNKIIVVDKFPTELALNAYVGTATDPNSYAALGEYFTRIYEDRNIDSNPDATQIAEALMSSIIRSTSRGIIVAPQHCGQELWDVVDTVDKRWP